MPVKFLWDLRYSVGDEVIDSQHRRLFDLGNEMQNIQPVSYTHLRAHETPEHIVCRLLLEKKTTRKQN